MQLFVDHLYYMYYIYFLNIFITSYKNNNIKFKISG
jgi:hypothetical protein